MTRRVLLVGLLAVLLIVAVVESAGGTEGATTIPALAGQIHQQTEATQAAVALANDVWVPRIAGLGLGLSVGLLAGGLGAYATRGESR